MSQGQFNKLVENIKETQNYPSLVVLKTGDNYILIDGHNRLEALRQLGHQEIWCEPWEVTEKQAKLILSTINRIRGTDDVQMRGKLMKELYDEFEGDKEFLLRLLPETEKSLEAILKVVEIDSNIDYLDDEREKLKIQLEGIMEPEEAERMSKMYKSFDDRLTLTFVFSNETDYYNAIRYFGKRPKPEKLIELLGKDGKK